MKKWRRGRAWAATVVGAVSLWLVVLLMLPSWLALLTLAICMLSNGLALRWWRQHSELETKDRHRQ